MTWYQTNFTFAHCVSATGDLKSFYSQLMKGIAGVIVPCLDIGFLFSEIPVFRVYTGGVLRTKSGIFVCSLLCSLVLCSCPSLL